MKLLLLIPLCLTACADKPALPGLPPPPPNWFERFSATHDVTFTVGVEHGENRIDASITAHPTTGKDVTPTK